jgi:hypothetical protein
LDSLGEKILITGFELAKEFTYGVIHCFNRKGNVYVVEKPEKKTVFPAKKDEKK